MTRLRYKKTETGLVSKWFKTPTDEVRVHITNTIDNKMFVIGWKNDNISQSDTFKTLNETKKAAKKALTVLGVVFENEVRPRVSKSDKTEVLKLYQDSIMEKE